MIFPSRPRLAEEVRRPCPGVTGQHSVSSGSDGESCYWCPVGWDPLGFWSLNTYCFVEALAVQADAERKCLGQQAHIFSFQPRSLLHANWQKWLRTVSCGFPSGGPHIVHQVDGPIQSAVVHLVSTTAQLSKQTPTSDPGWLFNQALCKTSICWQTSFTKAEA